MKKARTFIHFAQKKTLSFFFTALILCLLSACAPKTSTILQSPISPEEASSVWQKYTQYAQENDKIAKPFRINASVRMRQTDSDGTKRTNRARALLWGNGQKDDPLRIDLTVTFGTVIASFLFEPYNYLIYVPDEHTAWFYKGKEAPLVNLGTPLPISLDKVNALIHGKMLSVTGSNFAQSGPSPLDSRAIRFTLPKESPDEKNIGGNIDINDKGLLIAWQGTGKEAWNMKVSYDDNPSALPNELIFSSPNGYEITLFVNQRSSPQEAYSSEAMKLSLPTDTEWKEIGERNL